MKKILKRSYAFIILSIIALSLTMGLFACNINPQAQQKIMNLSLNPSVEFVLDGKNKVVSVSANNDEGNFIVANASFTGLTAEDAADLFLRVVKNNGFLIEGEVSSNENKLKIEVSGDTAQKIFNSVKQSLEDKMTELSVTVNFDNFEKITKAEIQALVKECFMELDEEQISQMSEDRLLEMLKNSRAETKDLLSEELKEYYYHARHAEILQAKFDKMQELINLLPDALGAIKTTFSNLKQDLIDALHDLNNEYKNIFLNQTSEYRIAVENFISAKKALLEGRLDSFELISKEQLESALENAEQALVLAKNTATGLIDTAYNGVISALNAIENGVQTIFSLIDMDKVNQTIETAKAQFAQNFKVEFSVQIADKYWNQLQPTIAN